MTGLRGLAGIRRDLTTRLATTGRRAFDHVPEKLVPPAYVLEPAEDYVAETDTFDKAEMRANVGVFVLVGNRLTSSKAVAELDRMLEDALNVLDPAVWSLVRVGRPDLFTTADWALYGVRLGLTTTFHLTESEKPA